MLCCRTKECGPARLKINTESLKLNAMSSPKVDTKMFNLILSHVNAVSIIAVPKSYKAPVFLEELTAGLTEAGTVSLECKVVGIPR